MTWDTWLAFFLACWLISLSPGAGAIASMSSGLNFGFRRGYWNAIGLQLALVLQIAVVAAGVGALLAASELAFALIQNPTKLGIQYHLTQFLLHHGQWHLNQLGDMINLHARIWLNNANEIGFQ